MNPKIYEVVELNKTSKAILTDNEKVSFTTDDFRLNSNLNINQTLNFTQKFFYTILGFTQSHFYPLNEIDGFY